MIRLTRYQWAAGLLLHSILNVAVAADAGTVMFAAGEVTAEREPSIALAKGDIVLDNDIVATGDASRAQLLLLDGAKIAIRPNSRLRIDEFVFQGNAGDSSAPVVAVSGDRSVATLIKGGLRTITGAIGKEDETAYEVRTPVGVLGIRGTEYSAVFCNADCDWVPGVNPDAPIQDGLYLGVTEGAIFFRNENGDIALQAGEYAFVPLVGRVPAPLATPPPVLLDDNDLLFNADNVAARPADDDNNSLQGFDSTLGTRRSVEPGGNKPAEPGSTDDPNSTVPAQPVNATDEAGNTIDLTPGAAPQPQGNRIIGYSTGPLGRNDVVFTGTQENEPSQYSLDANENLVGFAGPYPAASGGTTGDLSTGTALNAESGFDTVTVLRWGRWAGGIADVGVPAGQPETIDLNAQSLHWIAGADNAVPSMPISGAASYSLVGATSPTDSTGNVGVLGDASFQADFTNMRVDTTLSIDINSQTWTAAGTGNIGAAAQLPASIFSGNYSNVSVDGIGGGNGVFSGFFSMPGTSSNPAFPGGVGLTYSIQDGAGTTSVSGAAAFGNP